MKWSDFAPEAIAEQRQAMHRLLSWLAEVGQGSIKGWLLEAAEQAIDNGELDSQ